eukprot:366546-Chlamydomonas_euryale.AAC.16
MARTRIDRVSLPRRPLPAQTRAEQEPRKIEMSFNLSTYQPHLKKAGLDIYQTYYLDKRDKDMWTDTLVDKSKILLSRYMRQFAHTWKHFAFFVPWSNTYGISVLTLDRDT